MCIYYRAKQAVSMCVFVKKSLNPYAYDKTSIFYSTYSPLIAKQLLILVLLLSTLLVRHWRVFTEGPSLYEVFTQSHRSLINK